MRHRARGRLLLGAGRAATGSRCIGRAASPMPSSTGSSARRAGSSSPSPRKPAVGQQLVAALEQRAAVPRRHALSRHAAERRAATLSFSGQPVFDQRNKFKGYRGIARDVSAQIRAERFGEARAHDRAHARRSRRRSGGPRAPSSARCAKRRAGRPATSGASTRNATRSGTKSVGTPPARIAARC